MAELCLCGGKKLRERDFTGWTFATENDLENLMKTYESGRWGSGGEQNERFCREFEAYTGVRH